MKTTRLACPPSWREELHDTGRLLLSSPSLEIAVSGVGPLPDDPVSWIRHELDEPGALVNIDVAEDVVLRSGWPALLCEARVATETTLEKRLILLARFLEWGAVAMWRADAPLYDQERTRVLDLLGGLDIDWGESPLMTLAQVWDGID
jgi:hypothetical protein